MNLEIEHKYLLKNDSYHSMAVDKYHIIQGYLSRDKELTIRIRIKDDTAFLTIKTHNKGDARNEFEYPIPQHDAYLLIEKCQPPVLEKERYIVPYKGFVWEIDEFKRELSGITLAEIELPSSGTHYDIPAFIGRNVTGDPRYYNSNIHLLAKENSTQL